MNPLQGPQRACPVPSPDGLPCCKPIPIEMGDHLIHGGGHMWMPAEMAEVLERGHYDPVTLLSGRPSRGHLPEQCTPACPDFRDA